MAALVAAVHFPEAVQVTLSSGKWMARTSRAMTRIDLINLRRRHLGGPHLRAMTVVKGALVEDLWELLS
jgi:hypothetical protein